MKILNIYSDCLSMDAYLDQYTQYHKLCKALKKLKSTFRTNRYKANIVKISNYFINKDYSDGWCGLKKISKPAYSASTLHLVKSKSGQDPISLSNI